MQCQSLRQNFKFQRPCTINSTPNCVDGYLNICTYYIVTVVSLYLLKKHTNISEPELKFGRSCNMSISKM